ncbi:MAG: hypothetical protein ACTJLM_04115 [Ehrlichia sp.]
MSLIIIYLNRQQQHMFNKLITSYAVASQLKKFSIKSVRSVVTQDCKSGLQTWKDLARNDLSVNGHPSGLNRSIQRFDNSSVALHGTQYRQVLCGMLSSAISRFSAYSPNKPLQNELVNLLNQASLHGSLRMGIMQNITDSVKNIIIPGGTDVDVLPITEHFTTDVKVLSPSAAKITYIEFTSYQSQEPKAELCKLSCRLSFYVHTFRDSVVYSNPSLSLEAPSGVSDALFNSSAITCANALAVCANFFLRLRALITNSPLTRIPICKITSGAEKSTVTCSLPSSYICTTETHKEENSQKDKADTHTHAKTGEKQQQHIPTAVQQLKVGIGEGKKGAGRSV